MTAECAKKTPWNYETRDLYLISNYYYMAAKVHLILMLMLGAIGPMLCYAMLCLCLEP